MGEGRPGSCQGAGPSSSGWATCLPSCPLPSCLSASSGCGGKVMGSLGSWGLEEQWVAKWNWLDNIAEWEADGKLQQLGLRPSLGPARPSQCPVLWGGWGPRKTG